MSKKLTKIIILKLKKEKWNKKYQSKNVKLMEERRVIMTKFKGMLKMKVLVGAKQMTWKHIRKHFRFSLQYTYNGPNY